MADLFSKKSDCLVFLEKWKEPPPHRIGAKLCGTHVWEELVMTDSSPACPHCLDCDSKPTALPFSAPVGTPATAKPAPGVATFGENAVHATGIVRSP